MMKLAVFLILLLPNLAYAQSWENNPDNWQNSPDNWNNSPDNWKNSTENWDNAPDNWENSPENWQNSPENWKNSPDNHEADSIYDQDGKRTGYRVHTHGGGTIYFNNDGKRMTLDGKPLPSSPQEDTINPLRKLNLR